jgi:hypothetical protein
MSVFELLFDMLTVTSNQCNSVNYKSARPPVSHFDQMPSSYQFSSYHKILDSVVDRDQHIGSNYNMFLSFNLTAALGL